ncbi:carbohydrate-binding domain-containing protein [Enterococcus asini]|uniref:carbohydrate-binding domain-containing protein n=1 Tax=Enterococcus asini TaxID=57732 RepID=UPI001E3AF239|nr:carbohydrate-binding domain-containing protein [Enterococcus asini]MCD5028081.1 carbohydrate-binding domain-containing protein [Enterococcus asini]MDT2783783.1 carbohydrate-binding domain-containing protein [Enterococcus asini]
MNLKKIMASLLVASTVLGACSSKAATSASDSASASDSDNTSAQVENLATSSSSTTETLDNYYGTYEEEDLDASYDEDSATKITLGTTSEVSGDGATVADQVVTITAAGTYVVSGTLTDGQLVVNVGKEDKVHLILDGVDITNTSGPAIDIEQGEKIITTLAADSENTLADGENYELADGETEPDATFYSKENLVINGSGSLTVTGNYSNGIRSKDDLILISGTYNVTAQNNAIKGKDSVAIRGGDYTLTTTAGDGIQANNDEDAEKGYVAIDGGSFAITSGQDAIQAETNLSVQNAQMSLQTAEGAGSTNLDTEGSYKGLKAGGALVVASGNYELNTADDALHADDTVAINGGTITAATGDDGIHGDNSVTINEGTVTISQSYEGIEAAEIYFKGGEVNVTATDDGINAGGGSDTESTGQFGADSFGGGGPGGGDQADDSKFIEVSGGVVQVSAEGDGVDSNGNITMTGGTLLVNGPVSGGNGALDYNGTFVQSGGTLMAAGTSDMASNISDSSSQTAVDIYFNSNQSAGTLVTLTDSSGKLVAGFVPAKDFANLVISTPDLTQNEALTLAVGGTASQVADNGLVAIDSTVEGASTLGTLTLTSVVSNVDQEGNAVSASSMGMGGPR